MNQRQIQLVKQTWLVLSASPDHAAVLFYDRLFEIAPEIKPLFRGDMTEQGRKLMSMISIAVNGLSRVETIVPAIQQMGIRHTNYGVKDEHYEPVGTALLWTLEQGLGDDFTPEVKEAWTLTYVTLADVMKDAAAKAAA